MADVVVVARDQLAVITVGEVGPSGAAGPAGVGLPGPVGAVFFIEPEQGDDGVPVPGPAGLAGAPGSAGSVLYLEPQDGEDGMSVPGPAGTNGAAGAAGAAGATGASGPAGLPGPIVFLDPENGEDGMTIPGAAGPTGPAGSVPLTSVNVFTKNQSVAAVSLTSGSSIAVDASGSNNFKLVLGTNATLANPTNLTDGMVLNFRIKQDGTGSRTLAYGSKYKFPGGTTPVLSTAANAVDFMSCYYDSTDDTLVCVMSKTFS